MDDYPLIIFIDLFCGAGGVTSGAVRARMGKYEPVKVIACVNHDPLAIESHEYNHPDTLHFSEDIRTLNLGQLTDLIAFYRVKYPDAILLLWASLECTNYSKAKGGQPRDPDSRSLPNEMFRYIEDISPDYFYYENVEEFLAWGPLDENGRPESMKKGQDYLRWAQEIKDMGYRYERRVLNSANFGAYTKRKRLFGIFAKDDLPICWPEATHAETPKKNMFGKLAPWKAVRECLDFADEGKSLFHRKRPLVENTLKRIYAGLKKYVAANDSFIMKYYGNGDNVESIEGPAGTLTTRDRMALVQTAWLDKAYTGIHNHQSIDEPAGVILTKDKYALVQAFIDRQFSSGSHNHQSINEPHGALTTVPKTNLISVKMPFLMNPQYNSKGGSVEDPCFTLIASMNKRPPYLIQSKIGAEPPEIKESDTPIMVKIKEFCKERGIFDIRTRMLRVHELKVIQGFNEDYYLAGNQADQKKFIGNSVPPDVVKALMESLARGIKQEMKTVA